jgi:lactoylglutathione lyase
MRILGAELIEAGEPTNMKIANSWLIINVGGGPTNDKPNVILDTPKDKNKASNFMNIRVADVWSCYNE